jgi:light-regulated signal transduction histidine kinase (bacteriophytochrome)
MAENRKISETKVEGGIHRPDEESVLIKIIGGLNEHSKAPAMNRGRLRIAKGNRKSKDLDGLNRELRSFSYVSSHDLQEPLRKIQTFSSRILEKEQQNLSASGREYFTRMQNAARRMQMIIDDLVIFSKVNLDEKIYKKQDLNVIVKDVLEELQQQIAEKNATVEIQDLCVVNVIPGQFRQLMLNLISNSLKFSNDEKPAQIIIRGRIMKGNKLNHQLVPQKKYCHISVSDNGIGFDQKFCERIFEVFQRLHARDSYEGTGIGLAICKKIVENHKGMIHATGKPGEGSCFDIYIPYT